MPIKFWTTDKLSWIKANLNLGDAKIAEHFGTTKSAIKQVRIRNKILVKTIHYFTKEEDNLIMELYSNTRSDIIANKINIPIYFVYRRARKLGLKKSAQFLASPESGILIKGSTKGAKTQFKKGHVPANKGVKMSPEVRERLQHTFFKKGQLPHNTKSDFEISVRHGHLTRNNPIPYQYIRISKEQWKPLHRYLWEENNGPIPEGYNVTFKDGNSLNCSLKNLEMISNEELARKNQLAKWPEDLREVIKINNQLKNLLNDRH